jgi:hypothetical protein
MSSTSTVRQHPAKPRVFNGLAGSYLSSTSRITPQAKPKDPPADLILVHFCHDQERGASKPNRCNCKVRASKDHAYEMVDAKQADFLLASNPKTDKRVKIHRAIVVRRTIVAGEPLFAIAPPLKPDREAADAARRNEKHESIKAGIRAKARQNLQKLFAAGAISQQESLMSDADLDVALKTPEGFLAKLRTKTQRKRWLVIAFSWWENVLGFYRLCENTGQFMNEADRGKGLTVNLSLKNGQSMTDKLEQ